MQMLKLKVAFTTFNVWKQIQKIRFTYKNALCSRFLATRQCHPGIRTTLFKNVPLSGKKQQSSYSFAEKCVGFLTKHC